MIEERHHQAAHDVAGALQLVGSRLDAFLLEARVDLSNDDRIRLLSPIASGLARLLEAIDVATKPEAAPEG